MFTADTCGCGSSQWASFGRCPNLGRAKGCWRHADRVHVPAEVGGLFDENEAMGTRQTAESDIPHSVWSHQANSRPAAPDKSSSESQILDASCAQVCVCDSCLVQLSCHRHASETLQKCYRTPNVMVMCHAGSGPDLLLDRRLGCRPASHKFDGTVSYWRAAARHQAS